MNPTVANACPFCHTVLTTAKTRNAHVLTCKSKPVGLPQQSPTINPVSTNSNAPEPEPAPIPTPILTTNRPNQMQSDSSDDDTTLQRRFLPRPLPIINNQAEVTKMTVQKYNTVAIQYDEWLNMAKTCKSNNDLTPLLLDYLTNMMSRQKSEYLHEKQKIDQQFNMYAFTEDQDKLLFEYLPNIYMSNDNTDVERSFVQKYMKYVLLM
jgi:hypothetical protein